MICRRNLLGMPALGFFGHSSYSSQMHNRNERPKAYPFHLMIVLFAVILGLIFWLPVAAMPSKNITGQPSSSCQQLTKRMHNASANSCNKHQTEHKRSASRQMNSPVGVRVRLSFLGCGLPDVAGQARLVMITAMWAFFLGRPPFFAAGFDLAAPYFRIRS